MKKILVILTAIAMICMLLPAVANAATATHGETFDLSTLSVDEKLIVPSGATVTLTGTAPDGVEVECGAGVNLTLDNVTIENCLNYQRALSFTGTGNTLNLVGVSKLRSGTCEAAIEVEDTTELVINGPGEVYARGSGAGIGSSDDHDGGTITINSGTIKAEGRHGSAGIGGGDRGDGGTIIIKGGTVEAKGGEDAAGIGGGERGNGGTVIIEGGSVTASTNHSGDGGAGIGGGYLGNGGTIIIKGGTVVADGMYRGAGIGTGRRGDSSNIEISGGHIVATGHPGLGNNREDGSGTVNITGGEMYISGCSVNDIITGTLNISGKSVVFLEHDKANPITPNTTHLYSEYANDTQVHSKYRSDIPSTWYYPISSYMVNSAPYFTSDENNTSQTILTNDGVASLIVEDENGLGDIDRFELTGGSLPSGITLNSDGTFSGAAAKGEYTATIDVVDKSGLTDTTTLDVTVKDVIVTPNTKTLGLSEAFTASVRVYPSSASVAWSSSNLPVAIVDASGQVTAGGTIGRTIITAQTATGIDECIVYVVDKAEPAPAPDDPSKMVTAHVVDELGNPLAGAYVNLFSDPQTVVTNANGVAAFRDVPYNTNAPHTMIIEHPRGVERGRFTITFAKASASSASIDGDNVDVKFNNLSQNVKIKLSVTPDTVQLLSAEVVNYVPKVENPETGQDFAANIHMLGIAILLLLSVSLSIKIAVAKSR